jgi:hypothetical protein
MWSKLSTLITWHDSYSGCKFTALFLTAVGVFELIPTCTRWSWLVELIQTLTICISLDQDFVGLWVFVATGDQLRLTMSLWCHRWSTLLDYESLMPQVINFVWLWVFDATGDQLCWNMSLWCHRWSILLDYEFDATGDQLCWTMSLCKDSYSNKDDHLWHQRLIVKQSWSPVASKTHSPTKLITCGIKDS